MSQQTSIEWADSTWSPVRGCTRASEGCSGCYSERLCARNLPGLRSPTTGKSFAVMTPQGPRWTGRVELIENELEKPLHWRKPRRIFVCSMSDPFHEKLSHGDIDKVFAVMALCPQHLFLVLSKRAKWMRDYVKGVNSAERFHDINLAARDICGSPWYGAVLPTQQDGMVPGGWPLANVWLGVSVEDQQRADERIPWLLKTPAALRFVSIEPMLGPVVLDRIEYEDHGTAEMSALFCEEDAETCGEWGTATLNWVICGGENGPGARPMNPDWPRRVRDDCQAAAVPYFFKGWGEWAPMDVECLSKPARVGRKAAGRLLDGREWGEMPEVKGCQ